MSSWQIKQMMDGGHAEEAVAILSGGNTDPVVEERGTFEVVLPASSMNLPDGGWVELEIAGDAYFKGTAFAGSDGNVRFTNVPRQKIGTSITVSLTAFTPDGNPYSSGSKASVVEEGGETAFNVSLTDLSNPTVTYTDAILTDEAAEDGYRIVRYSWLNDEVAKFSVTNPYDDGSATMTVELDGNPLTGDAATGNITDQSLSEGPHTITVTLSKLSLSSDIRIEKKILVKKKAVEVSVPSVTMFHERDDDNRIFLCLDLYIEAYNSGSYSGRQTMFTCTNAETPKTSYPNMDTSKNTVTLTDPNSEFYFYTSLACDCGTSPYMGLINRGFAATTRTLENLKSPTSRSFDSGCVNSSGGACTDSGKRSHYWFNVTVTDKTYTAGTD
ncbi:MAG: hypothetical protein IJR93_08640 [Treponema sp.]|nr:hypothetical protein [Treponema sp.]